MRWLISLVVLLLLGGGAVSAQPAPSTLPLVQQGDWRYLGSFTVAKGGSGAQSTGYGGNGMGIGPNNTLYFGGHGQHHSICQVTIPAIGGTASLVGSCVEPPGGLGAGSGETKLGGTLLWNNRLIVSQYVYYDGDGSAKYSHSVGTPARTGFTNPVKVGSPNLNPGFYGGYMTSIPPEWRSLMGGPALTGQALLSIVSRTSYGPAAFVFDPDTVGKVNPVPATPLVYYAQSNPISNPDNANPYATFADTVAGIAFPPGTRSVLFIGRHGAGTPRYIPGEGYRSDPYVSQVWAYDANDLLKVKNGQLQPWAVKPYAMFPLPGSVGDATSIVKNKGSVTYDPATKRLYLAGDYSENPRVHVYELTVGTTPPPPPTEICGDKIDNDGDGQIDEGCPVDPPPPSMTVNVSTVAQLQNAVAAFVTGQTIVVAAGTYQLTQTLQVPQNRSRLTIKGATGNRDQVVIRGQGMTGGIAFGVWVDNVTDLTILDLTLREFREHHLIMGPGTKHPVVDNVRLVDAGDQFWKNNPSASGGVTDGVLRNSLLEYTSSAPDCYTNGLDVHHGANWSVTGTTFRNFRCSEAGQFAGPAILIWNGSTGTVVDGNKFVNNHRDISLGLDATKTGKAPVSNGALPDHSGGAITNNMIVRSPGQAGDVPIAVFDSPGTRVEHNSVSTDYANAVEYRFARTKGVVIQNNFLRGGIAARDGATGAVSNNVTNALPGNFVGTLDLHLLASAANAINKGVPSSVTTDIDGQPRPQGGASDLGADETGTVTLPPVNCIGSWGAWTDVLPLPACTTGTHTVTQQATYTITTQAMNGGTACEATQGQTRTQSIARPCTVTDPGLLALGRVIDAYVIGGCTTVIAGLEATPTVPAYTLNFCGFPRVFNRGDPIDMSHNSRPR